MTIKDIIFPEDISYGAQGGPAYNTDITVSFGGAEQRNANWSRPLSHWDVAHAVKTEAQLNSLRAFFAVVSGKLHAFRFKDWGEYTLTDENIGTGDGAEDAFQVKKTYAFDAESVAYIITRPRATGFVVKVNGVTKTVTTHYTLDASAGIITFTSGNIPGSGQAVTVTGEFDKPCRFDTDKLDISLDTRSSDGGLIGSWTSIPIVEIRE